MQQWRTDLLPPLIFYLLMLFLSVAAKPYRVTLKDGSPIEGHVVTAPNGKLVIEFLGIPYAEPPIGDLRFRRPIRKRPWSHVWNATKFSNSCVSNIDGEFGDFKGSQMWNPNTPLSEDCLYLNIWVPYNPDRREPLHVMTWIYGGGFWYGTASLDVYDGKILATEENVIVTSMNYRVSVFGFLYLGRPEAPGNMGLLDQLEALKWGKEHISSFGGNSEEITLFGESAGAASVSMQVISPLSRDYYRRAIMESGTATAPWAIEPPRVLLDRAVGMAEACRCNVTRRDDPPDMDEVLRCLQETSAEVLLLNEWQTFEFLDFPWTPVVEGYFFVEDPKVSLQRGNFKRSEVLMGSNFDESIYFIIYQLSNIFKKEIFFSEDSFMHSDAVFDQAVKSLLPRAFSQNPVVLDAILFQYKDWSLPGSAKGRQDALDKLFGDYHFTCSVTEFAEYYEHHGGTVFMYYFVHQSSQQGWPKWMGVLHGYEIPFIFGEPLNKALPYTAEEQELARRMMRYWANFARTG